MFSALELLQILEHHLKKKFLLNLARFNRSFYTFSRTVPLGNKGRGKRQRGLPIFRHHTWVCKPAKRWDLWAHLTVCYCWKDDFRYCSPLLPLLPSLTSAPWSNLFFTGTVTCSTTHELIQLVKSAESRVGFFAELGRLLQFYLLYLPWKSLHKHVTKRQSQSWKTYGILEIRRI